MNEMRDEGTTLLYVSHSMESVREVCDHVFWIEKGVGRMSGKVDDVCKEYVDFLK